ncbi:ninjurin-1-like isoform X1 [Triplophysa dalaica]|uniref:ninjurin-1-like isoform X1 n=1 Tax=Triplophysa dalaica TaxID=1582913 RepID=UPI0024E03B27|nr:ninjurin-1-like isoform X1 [Triplophysa dalaica]
MENQTLNQSWESPDTEKEHRPFNMNHYAIKKSAAQSMLDVALLMANSSQLKTVLHAGPNKSFYIPLILMISLSIILQIIVGVLLVFIVKNDLNDVGKQSRLNSMNNVATVIVFFIVIVNIFITALGFESGRPGVMTHAAVSQTQTAVSFKPNST